MTLTKKQDLFAYYIAEGEDKGEAAIKAGYAKRSAHVTASRTLKMAKVQKRIKELQNEKVELLQQRFVGMADKALQEMFSVLMDEDTPPQVKTNTAKILLDYAGFKPVDKQETQLSGGVEVNDPFAGLTTKELRKLADLDD